MHNIQKWAWLLFFGSLWGLSEVVGGGLLYAADIPRASIFLGVWALFLLATARGLLDRPGSSTLIAGVAALFKLVNAGPFICHLLGIFLLGAAFDAAASIWSRSSLSSTLRRILTGITAAYGGYALFALSITYLIRYEYWAEVGWPKVSQYIFVSGSLTALLAALVVPAGCLLSSRVLSGLRVRPPRWLYAGTLAATALFWILGRFSG